MAAALDSVDVPVALLGYGRSAQRSTGCSRTAPTTSSVRPGTGFASFGRSSAIPAVSGILRGREGVLTTDFAAIRDDPAIAVVAEVMGGIEPTADYVLDLLRAGKHVVSANKQLVARRGAELFAAASEAGVQLRFEASVCAAIPVIKVLREALVVTNVHRVLGIVNGTTNFILTEMERGSSFADALAEAQRLGYAEADPTEDVSGADAAAKMAILATVAFGSRVGARGGESRGHRAGSSRSTCRRPSSSTWSSGSSVQRRSSDGAVDVRVHPAFVDRRHPLASVEGPFNAVMLQGDAIREITLDGPGAGGVETASAVVADMVSVVGTTGTGFLQNDACWRTLERCRREICARRSTCTSRSPTGRACSRTSPSGWRAQGVSIARLAQQPRATVGRARPRHARCTRAAASTSHSTRSRPRRSPPPARRVPRRPDRGV